MTPGRINTKKTTPIFTVVRLLQTKGNERSLEVRRQTMHYI